MIQDERNRPAEPNDRAPRLLIVNGLPASGKTTLSRAIAPALGLPLFSKDAYKDLLFDHLGWSDRAWSMRIGGAAWEILWSIARDVLASGGSVAIESSFFADKAAERLAAWRTTMPMRVVELHCSAERSILAERFRARALGPDRHPGHDETNEETLEREFLPRLLTADDPLIPGVDAALTVDTSDPAQLDYAAILTELRALLWPKAVSVSADT
ncbi:MAG: ATP-binding protein [Thermomicrobiales bacterium]|nr:ATP-binding protein [Thermomicrobiales bacterium]